MPRFLSQGYQGCLCRLPQAGCLTQEKIISPEFWRLKAGTTPLAGSHSSEVSLLGCPSLHCCLSVRKHPGVSAHPSFCYSSSVRLNWTRCRDCHILIQPTFQRSCLQSQSHSEVQGGGGHRGEARACTCIWEVTAQPVATLFPGVT